MLAATKSELPNYKGVMICSRPEAGVKLKRDRVTPKEQVGINPIKRYVEPSFSQLPSRKSPTISRDYKVWLKQFEGEMDDRANQAVQDQDDCRSFFLRFREKSRLDRAKWRQFKEESGIGSIRQSKSKASQWTGSGLPIDYRELIANVLQTNNPLERDEIKKPAPTQSASRVHRQVSRKVPSKDWPRSAQEAEACEETEVNDLVSFMNDFDPEVASKDAEMQAIVESIMERVREINREGGQSYQTDPITHQVNSEHQLPKPSFRLRSSQVGSRHLQGSSDVGNLSWQMIHRPFTGNGAALPSQDEFGYDASTRSLQAPKTRISTTAKKRNPRNGGGAEQVLGFDAAKLRKKVVSKIATAILKSDPNMAHVHSNASVSRMIQGLVEQYLQDNQHILHKYISPQRIGAEIPGPRTAIHAEQRMKEGPQAQHLPFLYPSPLV